MEVEEIKSSRGKAVLFLLISLACVVTSVTIARQSGAASYKSWLAGGFFSLCSFAFAWLLIRPQRLLLTPNGFTVAGGYVWLPKEVLWRDVTPFFVYRLTKTGDMIGYNFSPSARKATDLTHVGRFVGFEEALPRGWPGSPERMVERINAYRAKALAEDAAAGPWIA